MFGNICKRVIPIVLSLIVLTGTFDYLTPTVPAYADENETEEATAEVLTGENSAGDSATDEVSADDLADELVDVQEVDKEFRAVWIAYYDFVDSQGSSKSEFTKYVDEMFDNSKNLGMNAVVVHVRPFSDAMYKSEYYPWSSYASGQQGINPGYDPLQIMVEEAHERELEIHAWLNPYRVTTSWNYGTDVSQLSKKNPARKWLTNKKTTDDRYVLEHDGALYYNPSVPAVRKLIVNGVKEIVENYDVDGIHFDDYFYPALGSKYETLFDAQEYEAYKKKRKAAGKKVLSIDKWRMYNVNTLVKEVYSAVKETRSDCIFGISPGGYIDYFDDKDRWYVDYRTWMKEDGYVDYICPQLYWSFNNRNIFPFYDTLLAWAENLQNENVKLYVGLPAYKMNERNVISSQDSLVDTEWYNQYLLADMVRFLRRSGKASGFIVFDYSDLVTSKNAKAAQYMKEEIEG